MSVTKRILQSNAVQALACWITAQYIRFVAMTGRWETIGGDIPEAFWKDGKPFILAFWHGRLLMMPRCWTGGKTIHMLISQHRDGQLIARTVAHFGIKTIAGSTSKGGASALRSMLKTLKGGGYVGITPDGPRGPRMRASDGVVSVARMSGVPVIPATFGVTKRKILGSWDRFVVAKPFARGVIVWGDPIEVPRDADKDALEDARLKIEQALIDIGNEADRLCNQAVIAPAEPVLSEGDAA